MPKCPDKFTPKSPALHQPAVSHLYAKVVYCACAHLEEGRRWLVEKTFLYCGFSLFSNVRKSRFVEYFFWLFKWSQESLFFVCRKLKITDILTRRCFELPTGLKFGFSNPYESKSATVLCLYLSFAKLSSGAVAQVSRCQSSSLFHAFMRLW